MGLLTEWGLSRRAGSRCMARLTPCLGVSPHVCHTGPLRAHVADAVYPAVSQPARSARLRRPGGDLCGLEDVQHAWTVRRQAAPLIQRPEPGQWPKERDATQPDTCDDRDVWRPQPVVLARVKICGEMLELRTCPRSMSAGVFNILQTWRAAGVPSGLQLTAWPAASAAAAP